MYMYIYICIKDTHTVARGQQGGPVVVGSGDGEVYCACRCARWRGGDVLVWTKKEKKNHSVQSSLISHAPPPQKPTPPPKKINPPPKKKTMASCLASFREPPLVRQLPRGVPIINSTKKKSGKKIGVSIRNSQKSVPQLITYLLNEVTNRVKHSLAYFTK